jgi:hypothetical protein
MLLKSCRSKCGEDTSMKHFLIIASVLAIAPAFAQQAVPEIAFDSVPNVLKLPPDLHLGEASGVAVNSKGHLFVFNRGNTTGPAYGATAAQVLEFGPDGKYLREIGKNLYAWSFAHTVRIDKDDNLWAVDKGSDMIIKFNPEGRVVMVFGRKKEASDEGDGPWTHPKPPRPATPASSGSRPTSPGTRRATYSLATATLTRASPSMTRTGTG